MAAPPFREFSGTGGVQPPPPPFRRCPMSLRDALRIPAAQITDERVYLERRRLLQTLAAAPALALAGCAEAEPPAPPVT